MVDKVDGDSVRKYVVPAVKRVGSDLLEFIAPEIAEVISDREIFKTVVKAVRRQILRKQLGSGSRKRTAIRVVL